MEAASTDTEWGQAATTTTNITGHDDPYSKEQVTDSVDLAIIGGGLSGLATAIGLLHHQQLDPRKLRIYERAPALRCSSQGMLSLWRNGLQALGYLHPGLPNLATQAGSKFKTRVLVRIDADGKSTETTDSVEPGTVLIRWHALQQVLAQLLPSEMIVPDHSLLTFVEQEDSVLLRFENGNVVRAKIVIGADGTFSTVRKVMAFPNDHLIYFGQMNWNAVVPTSSLPANVHLSNAIKAISSDAEPKWSSFINDCGGSHSFVQLRIADPTKALALSGNRGRGGLGLKGVKENLLPIVQASRDLTAVLEAIPEEQIFERCIAGRLVASSWRSNGGMVALLGDSAHGMHPAMGQGANSAFESAAVLVKSLLDCDGDWKSALEQYEKNRRPKADWVQRSANLMGCANEETKKSVDLRKWFAWPTDGDQPPEEGRDFVMSFDPLSQAGVSPMM